MSATGKEEERQDGPTQKNERVLEAAELTLQEDQGFRSKALQFLHIKPNAVKSSLPELERQIQAAQSPRREASISLQAADGAQKQWEEKGQVGSRRIGHGVQTFITKFAGFVQVYAGFVDLIRQSNGGYAEAAYSTLSLLFMVAIKKSENDKKYADTLEELKDSFPRMKLAEDLYQEASVKIRVSRVYREVVLFARASFKYFTEKTWRRITKAIVSPAAIELNQTIEKIHSCLAEANAQIGILLHQRVHEIAETNKGISGKSDKLLTEVGMLRTTNSELVTEIGLLQTKNDELVLGMRRMEMSAAQDILKKDRENLEDFRRLLGNIPPKFEDDASCRKVLSDAFPGAFGSKKGGFDWSERYIQMTAGILDSNPEYRKWRECSTSCLLVLGGLTESEGQASQSTCSWLSPASSHIVQNLVTDKKTFAFFSCHPDTRSRHTSSRLMVSSLLSQLLARQPSILRNRAKEFKSVVRSEKWDAKEQDEALDCQFGLLARALKELPEQGELFVVLDRLDMCECPKHNILTALQRLIGTSPSLLKVAVFMDRIMDSNDRRDCRDLVSSDKICRTFGRIDWDQQRNSS